MCYFPVKSCWEKQKGEPGVLSKWSLDFQGLSPLFQQRQNFSVRFWKATAHHSGHLDLMKCWSIWYCVVLCNKISLCKWMLEQKGHLHLFEAKWKPRRRSYIQITLRSPDLGLHCIVKRIVERKYSSSANRVKLNLKTPPCWMQLGLLLAKKGRRASLWPPKKAVLKIMGPACTKAICGVVGSKTERKNWLKPVPWNLLPIRLDNKLRS